MLEMEKGSIDVETSDHHYDPPPVPESRQVLHAGAVPPVRQAAVREGLPGRGDLAGAGRHHGDRLRLVHRLPLLRGGLSLLGAAVQLRRAADSGRESEPGHGLSVQPAAAEGRDGEVHLLPAPHARGPLAGLPGGLPDRLAQVRQRARSGQRGGLHPAAQAGLRAEGGRGHDAAVLLLLRRTRQPLSRADRRQSPREDEA